MYSRKYSPSHAHIIISLFYVTLFKTATHSPTPYKKPTPTKAPVKKPTPPPHPVAPPTHKPTMKWPAGWRKKMMKKKKKKRGKNSKAKGGKWPLPWGKSGKGKTDKSEGPKWPGKSGKTGGKKSDSKSGKMKKKVRKTLEYFDRKRFVALLTPLLFFL